MHDTPTQSTERLDEIIAEYLAAEEAGDAPPPEDLLAAHPDLADELRKFLANRDEFAAVLPGDPPRPPFVPPRVRYFGDYELLEVIARGGMGVVYKARQTSLNRIVALKMILAGHLAGEEDVRRFLFGTEETAQLKHPGIVPVHEVGEHEGFHYFSMDYIEGRTLAEIVRENPLPARQAATYVRAIAEAVHYAHQQGTLHRDLKPSNVLIDGADQVHVTDFGLAGRVDGDGDLTRTGQILGTPSYMPPEQAEGKRGLIGPASDVYSIGATLYCLLTARPPFRAESPVETLQQVIESEPVSPRLLNATVPRDLETICLKCLRKEPHRRYATAGQLAKDLGRFLKGEPIRARPVGRVERAWRWCIRNPALAGLNAALAVAIVIGFSGIALQWYRAEQALSDLTDEHAARTSLEGTLDDLESRRQALSASVASLESSLSTEQSRSTDLASRIDSLESRREQLATTLEDRQGQLADTLVLLADDARRRERLNDARQYLSECPVAARNQQWQELKRRIDQEPRVIGRGKCMALSPDGRMLAVGNGNNVTIRDLQTNSLPEALSGQTASVSSLAFSPDGTHLASVSGGDSGRTIVWNVKTRNPVRQLPGGHRIAYAAGGDWLAVQNGNDVRIWRAAVEGEVLNVTMEYGDTFDGVGGNLLAVNNRKAGVTLYDLISGQSTTTIAGTWRNLSFSPTGEFLALAGEREGVVLWSMESHTRIGSLPDDANHVTISPDGRRLAYVAGYKRIRTWDTVGRRLLAEFLGPSDIDRLAFSQDGTRLAFLTGGNIVVWNLATYLKEYSLPLRGDVAELQFALDGRILLAKRGESIEMWETPEIDDVAGRMVDDIATLDVGLYDCPQRGRSRLRNNVAFGVDVPQEWNIDNGRNVLWKAVLGTQSFGDPTVANGKVYVGTNNHRAYLERFPRDVDLGVLLCLDERTGEFVWQYSSPKLPTGFVHDWPEQGICASPVIDGDRLWVVTNRCEVVCLDTEGFRDGENDGPFTGEDNEHLDEADVVWKFDMMGELGVSPHNMSCSSIAIVDNRLFLCTSNGVDESHINIPAPDAPSFIALERDTGRVVWTDNSPGTNILHGQWASPAYGVFDGQPQVIFSGGDGWLYSFDPAGDGGGNSKLLWKFDCNPKTALYSVRGRSERNHFVQGAMICDGLVYVSVGEDPEHGEGNGHLWCIDPTKRGDVSAELAIGADGQILPPRRLQCVDVNAGERAVPNPNSAAVWHFTGEDVSGNGKLEFEEEMHRSMGMPAISDGLLYIADYSGIVHCLDAKTGRTFWSYDMFSICWGSPLIADGKVYVGYEEGGVIVFEHSAELNILGENDMGNSVYTTPIMANNVLYIANRNTLYAIGAPRPGSVAADDSGTVADAAQ